MINKVGCALAALLVFYLPLRYPMKPFKLLNYVIMNCKIGTDDFQLYYLFLTSKGSPFSKVKMNFCSPR